MSGRHLGELDASASREGFGAFGEVRGSVMYVERREVSGKPFHTSRAHDVKMN
jgi:hypothetical protein